ncbi:MAG: superoxide dismutase [Ni] [Coraliomargaritaceae bacterium]
MQTPRFFLLSLILCLCWQQPLSAHCQVPCGIYGDHTRVQAMLEDAETVLKACRSMEEISGKTDTQSKQQFIRWVNNKESHAQKIIETIGDYFLTQRVKPTQADYAERLRAHHAVILTAMKAKQNASVDASQKLHQAVKALLVYYPSE